MAVLHKGKRKMVSSKQDTWADVEVWEVPFQADNKPRLRERLREVLVREGLVFNRVRSGLSQSVELEDVRVEPDGTGVAVLRGWFSIGD